MLGPAEGKAWDPGTPARLKAEMCLQSSGSRCVSLFSGVSCTCGLRLGEKAETLFPVSRKEKAHQANDSSFNSNHGRILACSIGPGPEPHGLLIQ